MGLLGARRWLARLAFVAAAAAVVVLLAVAGRRSIALVAVGAAGLAVCLVAVWWFLVHRGVLRWLAAVLAVAAPLAVLVVYARSGLLWLVVLCVGLWAGAVAAGRLALVPEGRAGSGEYDTPPPRRPFLIMNPRSGDGKVQR